MSKYRKVASKAAPVAANPTAGYTGDVVDANARMAELERRDTLAAAARHQSDAVAAAAGSDRGDGFAEKRQFEDPTQKVVVVNIAHRNQRPKKDRPALRLLGVFDSDRDADEYIREAAPLLVGCNMWKLPMMRWMILCKNTDRQQDGLYTMSKIETLKVLYQEDKAKREADFAHNRAARKQGDVNQSLEKQKAAQREKHNKKSSSRLKALRQKARTAQQKQGIHADAELNEVTTSGTNNVPASLIRRKQDYVVVSWMRDVSKSAVLGSDDPEPCCIVWRFFATYELACEWVKDVGSQYVRDFDLEVVDNYEWLFPEDVERDKITEMYRHAEQNAVMLQRKAEATKVLNFEQWCQEKKVEVPVTEVIADQMGSSLQPTGADSGAGPSGPIRLPARTFEAKVETKHPDTEPVIVTQESEKDFAYLRRPLLPANTKSEANYPAPVGDGAATTIHAPLD